MPDAWHLHLLNSRRGKVRARYSVNYETGVIMRVLFLTICSVLVAGSAYAGGPLIDPVVPEIDALSGLAAVAAVGGALTLIWERRRRK